MKLQLFNPEVIAKKSKEMEFKDTAKFNDGDAGVFWSGKCGPSPWEMHPDCDELLHVIEGEIDVEILPNGKGKAHWANIKSGWFLVVPRGCWHRQYIRKLSTEFYLTPGETLHSHDEDPRIVT